MAKIIKKRRESGKAKSSLPVQAIDAHPSFQKLYCLIVNTKIQNAIKTTKV